MGVRQIRYCDVSGSEHDVETHALNIDQMHVEIDLAAEEYRKLLQLLRPYLDAGRVEASMPDLPSSGKSRRTTRPRGKRGGLSTDERAQLRQWAEEKGLHVPVNNRFKGSVIEQWRQEMARPSRPKRPENTLFSDVPAEPSPAVETPTATAPTATATAAPEPTPADDTAPQHPAQSRRDRVGQVLLARPRTWLTVAEIADLAEERTTDTPERNATSELLRRMANDGEAERDDSTRPVHYRAVPEALHKRLPDNA